MRTVLGSLATGLARRLNAVRVAGTTALERAIFHGPWLGDVGRDALLCSLWLFGSLAHEGRVGLL